MITAVNTLLSHPVEVGFTLACVAVVVGMLPAEPPARARMVRVMAASLGVWAVASAGALMASRDAPMLSLLSAAAAASAALAVPCLQAGDKRGDAPRVRPSMYVLLAGVVIATVHAPSLREFAAGFMACAGVVAWAMWRPRGEGGARAAPSIRVGLSPSPYACASASITLHVAPAHLQVPLERRHAGDVGRRRVSRAAQKINDCHEQS